MCCNGKKRDHRTSAEGLSFVVGGGGCFVGGFLFFELIREDELAWTLTQIGKSPF